jgi:hypothetical protein
LKNLTSFWRPIWEMLLCSLIALSFYFFFFFFFFLTVLEFALRTLCLLGRYSSTWTTPPALFALVIFQRESYTFSPVWPQTMIFLCNSSQVIGIADECHYVYLVLWARFSLIFFFFTQASLKLWYPISVSWVSGIPSVSYHTRPPCSFYLSWFHITSNNLWLTNLCIFITVY